MNDASVEVCLADIMAMLRSDSYKKHTFEQKHIFGKTKLYQLLEENCASSLADAFREKYKYDIDIAEVEYGETVLKMRDEDGKEWMKPDGTYYLKFSVIILS